MQFHSLNNKKGRIQVRVCCVSRIPFESPAFPSLPSYSWWFHIYILLPVIYIYIYSFSTALYYTPTLLPTPSLPSLEPLHPSVAPTLLSVYIYICIVLPYTTLYTHPTTLTLPQSLTHSPLTPLPSQSPSLPSFDELALAISPNFRLFSPSYAEHSLGRTGWLEDFWKAPVPIPAAPPEYRLQRTSLTAF